jgi:metal-responsive CopG/Arc/MetJ family transcriptional regulator
MGTERLNITIPSELAEKFRKRVKPRKRSEFISQAIVKKLDEIEKKHIQDLLKEGYLAVNLEEKELRTDFDITSSDGIDD